MTCETCKALADVLRNIASIGLTVQEMGLEQSPTTDMLAVAGLKDAIRHARKGVLLYEAACSIPGVSPQPNTSK